MIVITGAAGFIGSNLAHRLAAMGLELRLVDHPLTVAKPANWVGLSAFEFMDHQRFLTTLPKANHYEAIFHLGACSATTEQNWKYLQANNVDYTRTLWDWCVKHNRPFIYASSAATYGDGSKGFDDRTPPTELEPLNLYGKSKNDFDIWALTQSQTPPSWAGMKFFNVFGPRELHKGRMASVVYHTWKQVKATGGMKLFKSNDPKYADGCQLRDFVYVNDCVNHMVWLWQSGKAGGIYNSGTGNARTFYDLAKAVFVALGLTPKIDFIDMPGDLAGKYQNYTQAVMTKLYSLGYPHPPTSLEQGVAETVKWLESQ